MSVFTKLFAKKSIKKKAAVFVDFEHWYIALDRNFGLKPDIKQLSDELSEEYEICEFAFFGDFSNPSLANEMHKIRGFTNKIVETNNGGGHYKKDFTDFIMLDHIYRSAFLDKEIDTYVIFTGDGHFSSAVLFLKNSCKKNVVVYGVKNAFSGQLKQAASAFIEVPEKKKLLPVECEYVLKSLYELEKGQKNARPTFLKTVPAVAAKYNVKEEKVKLALEKLIEKGYISQYEVKINKRRVRLLKTDYEKAADDGIFKP